MAVDVKVPDIGDFHDVPIIEIHVRPGDAVQAEDSLITLESEKATMDVPAPQAGVVKELKVAVGDKLSAGAVVLILDESGAQAPSAAAKQASASADAPAGAAPAPAATAGPAFAGTADIETDMLVLGAGPGGYAAAFRAADLGMRTVLVERFATLGGVCLNVGCIPSKALLHVAAVMEEARRMADAGIGFAEPAIELDKLRAHKSKVVAKLTGGLAGMAKARKVQVVRGYGRFLDAHHLEIEETMGDGQARSGARKTVRFEKCIIAAGSSPVRLPFLPDDPRIVDSTGALELRARPGKLLVIGGGIIGLEMATVYSALGSRIDVVEMLDALMQGPDRDCVKTWQRQNARRFDNVWLSTQVTGAEARDDGIWVSFAGGGGQAPAQPQRYDMLLQAAGRTPNGGRIGADKAGLAVDERGFIPVDGQMRTNVPHIFAIGDVVGQPMLAHKATHQGHVAAESAAGQKAFFDAMAIPNVAYTDPEIAWVGLGEDEARRQGRKVETAKFPWAASGRAIANGADYGFTKLVFDGETRRCVGGAIVGPNAGDMIGEITLAIEMGADAEDIGRTVHPHPTLGETIGLAAEVAHGSCTDLPPPRK